MRLRFPPPRQARQARPAVPPRTYEPRPRIFRLTARDSYIRVFCALCQETLPDVSQWGDVAALAGQCRRHEIACHSVTVTWEEFRAGVLVEFPDPEWQRARLTGQLSADADTEAGPVITRLIACEWLDDDAAPGAQPGRVKVRDTQALVRWLGADRAARELVRT